MSQSPNSSPIKLSSVGSRGRFSKTFGYYAAFVVLGLTVASLGPTLPGLAEHTRTNLSEISFLFTARSLGYLLGALLGGRLYDRLPGHPIMVVAMLAIAAMLGLMPILPLLWLLTAVLLILGLAEGVLDVGGNTLIVWVHVHKVGPFMNGLHFFFGVGAFLSPIIIAQMVLMSGDITWAYWILALLILPVAIGLLMLPSPTQQTPSKERLAKVADRSLLMLIVVFLFFYVGAEGSFGGWVFSYAVALDLAKETLAAYLTAAFWGAFTVGRLVGIPASVRFRPRYILLADLVGSAISIAIILIWPHSLVALWVGGIAFGLAMASVFPTVLSLAERRMTITGQVTGWFFVGASLGGMFLPWLIGQFFEAVGPQTTMLIIFVDLLAATLVFFVLIFRFNAKGNK